MTTPYAASYGRDFAVLRLDRSVMGRAPARVVRDAFPLPLATPVAVAGHPIGLPLKLAQGGTVHESPFDRSYEFAHSTDVFGGNSGSATYLDVEEPRPMAGVLVSAISKRDYDYDASRGCMRYARHGAIHVFSTYAHLAINDFCARTDDPSAYPQLCACGDGVCDPAALEDSRSCATDCAVACGDGYCADGESPASCAADCGACGDGVCDGADDCCEDCGCGGGKVCAGGVCAFDAAVGGASCASFVPVEPVGAQELHAFGGAGRVFYGFTLAAPTRVELEPLSANFLQDASCRLITVPADRVLPAGEYRIEVWGSHGELETTRVLFSAPGAAHGRTCFAPLPIAAEGHVVLEGDMREQWHAHACLDTSDVCGGEDVYYAFVLDEPALVEVSTELPHAVLRLERAPCAHPAGGAALAMAVDRSGSGTAALQKRLEPGMYALRLST
ncbi:MAG: trypsin-like peptidase domain-containing protein, partial [Polyangiaceae bacterium]|nr:trypsin-like peptidase domain-containing protein [Polyangiaceae bacterium]